MALQTQLVQPDDTLQAVRWGWWHLGVLHDAMVVELDDDNAPMFPNEYTFTEDHTYVDESDGEVFTVVAGTTYRCSR